MRMARLAGRTRSELPKKIKLEDYDGSFNGKATLTADRGGYGVRHRCRKVRRVFLAGGVHS